MMIRQRFPMICLLLAWSFGIHAQALKSDTIDVLNYSISLDLKHLSHQQLYASTEIRAIPVLPAISSFSLDLRKLTVDSVLLNGTVHPAYTYDDTVLRILLSVPLTPADTFFLRVVYHGVPLIEPYNWGGFHFLSDSTLAFNLGVAFEDYPHNYGRVWFPCLDDFIDRATYDFHIRTKSTHKAVCGGMPAGSTTHPDGSITWHWTLAQPIPTYLASVAAGDFAVLQWNYAGMNDTIPVMIYVRPADSSKAVISFSNLNAMLGIFESRYGPYQWPRVGYAGTTKGAMEHAMNIAMPRNLITGNHTYDWLIAHELSHHWFGDLLTCASAGDMWINEGWARYSEAIFTEGMLGWEAYKTTIMDLQKQVLNFAHTASSGGDGSWFPLYPVPQTHTYGTTVYDKGGIIAHTLRGYLGDSVFFDAIKALLVQFAFQPVSSYQMRDFLSQHTGINLAPFFDGWVFTPGFPHFSIDSVSSLPQAGGWNVTVHVKQKMLGRSVFTGQNIVEIGFYQDRHSREIRRLQFSNATGQQTFWLPFNPALVLMDPEDRLSDAITAETRLIGSTGVHQFGNEFFKLKVNSLSDSIMIRVEHSFAPPDPLPQPVPGLTLSPNRYWKISGFIPQTADLEGLFSFSTGNQYDNALITNTKDSLVILYRKDAGEPWQGIPFTKTPAAYTGTITVDHFQSGEYTLAKWDEAHIGINQAAMQGETEISLFPNPSDGKITIRCGACTLLQLRISSMSGDQVLKKRITFFNGAAQVDLTGIAPGIYVAELAHPDAGIVKSEKITICR